jgi:hypothetical protein
MIAGALLAYWVIGAVIVWRRCRQDFRGLTDWLLAAVAAWFWPLFRKQ